MNKFGREKECAENKLTDYEDMRSVHRGNLGGNGQLRLFLPNKTFADNVDTTFIEGGAKQFGGKVKDPTDQALEGVISHVHHLFGEHGINRSDAFFGASA